MIKLHEINWSNLTDILAIQISNKQKEYLPCISVFLAQSYVNLKENYDDESLAIYNDKELIGYTKIVLVPKDEKPYHLDINSYMIDALIIDKNHQSMGYGKATLKLILERLKEKTRNVTLCCYQKNNTAISFFSSFGFTRYACKNKQNELYIWRKTL